MQIINENAKLIILKLKEKTNGLILILFIKFIFEMS